jgi:hypothetical protein
MKVFMMWNGGYDYSAPSLDDVEEFDTIKDAIRSFDSRADSWNTYYPLVNREESNNGGQSAWLFFTDPRDPSSGNTDTYPDQILEYGPRGGLKRYSA